MNLAELNELEALLIARRTQLFVMPKVDGKITVSLHPCNKSAGVRLKITGDSLSNSLHLALRDLREAT